MRRAWEIYRTGPPPPMRGKGYLRRQQECRGGITPAYAGKSLNSTLILFMIKDHPRLCGEKMACTRSACLITGSPPPMRGKVEKASRCVQRHRITPAYAGKSFSVLRNRDCTAGSPPPMRGKVREFLFFRFILGITPAYAGKRDGCGF